jgi:hypothetical protein
MGWDGLYTYVAVYNQSGRFPPPPKFSRVHFNQFLPQDKRKIPIWPECSRLKLLDLKQTALRLRAPNQNRQLTERPVTGQGDVRSDLGFLDLWKGPEYGIQKHAFLT